MESLCDLLKIEKVKARSNRDLIIKDIYSVYTSDKQKLLRKKENWKRYVAWLKANRVKDSKESQAKFKKTKQFIKEMPIRTIAILLARNKVDRLYEILSEAKDQNHRNQNASAFIINNRFI
jgi:50S ribosomal subunit-associated GTPase HflX